ncbi:hypothetical protein PHMEG_00012428 [Phytophthora megakarya]|uniref:Uncharacterized protein n=1 Tax=Phytophthora megakarya TaxID=4795 RepID=A0A225WBB5_9STRA|nr:hypothetical protein PHMEG_00012428 [Phytophthora megakarya]
MCGPHKSVITTDTKEFILRQDECMIPSHLIVSNMRRSAYILQPSRAYPTLAQISNCTKYLRNLQGPNTFYTCLQKCAYNPTGDLDRAVCFGYQDDVNGYPYIGKGTDADSFAVGVTGISLVPTCIEYTASSRVTLFHADATFKLSDLGYPAIICWFSDASRS